MRPSFNVTILFFLLVIFQGCNTLYYSRVVNIEILEPGKIYFPPNKNKIAIKYNNCNEGYNPHFAEYFDGQNTQIDSSNLNDEAARVYFDLFIENINKNQFFEEVIQLESSNFSDTEVIDTVSNYFILKQDSTLVALDTTINIHVEKLAEIINSYPRETEVDQKSRAIHPQLGLYNQEDINKIADTTDADLLLSLDFFATTDITRYSKRTLFGYRFIQVLALWNIYDIETRTLSFSQFKLDSVRWTAEAYNIHSLKQQLPPRRDAVLNAADIAGSEFADFLVPHWAEVQRMYYTSGHIELKETNKLVQENRWLDAAKIWKANVNNPNKNIVAKCKFNLGLVCEMEGDFEAALDWVVQSFHELGSKNTVHFDNCQQYIKILSHRMLDIKKIKLQYNNAKI